MAYEGLQLNQANFDRFAAGGGSGGFPQWNFITNFLPNPQWQLWSGLGYITKQNEAGTGPQTAITSTAYTLTTQTPTFTTTNTQTLRVNDLVVISGGGYQWGYGGVGYISTATSNRVTTVTPNTSVVVVSQLGGVSPIGSAGTVLTPIQPGDLGTGTGQGADGWKKTGTLTVWPDDWSANACPGAIRVLGMRKGAAGDASEDFYWTVSPNQIGAFRGRQVTFGVLVYQKVQQGSGTFRIYTVDNVTGRTYSARGTGASYVNPNTNYGGYQFLTVTATVAMAATTLSIGITTDGEIGDVCYAGTPTAVYGANLGVGGLGIPPSSFIRPVGHWNPPLTVPLAMTFPATEISSGLYGFSGQDLEAMSQGVVHNSVVAVECKIELTTTTVGATLFTGSRLDYSLIFGPQVYTQVASVTNAGQGWLPLADDGTFTIFTGTMSLAIQSATFDFWNVQLTGPAAQN